jgi:hypothetical protein
MELMLKDPDMSQTVQTQVDIEAKVIDILAKRGLIPGPGFVQYTLDEAMSSGKVLVYIWMSKR